ncbi:MAG: hypothetical protein RLZZ500_857 [Bacteroidota bacterium]|jgi:AraC-like DNA-binding protein
MQFNWNTNQTSRSKQVSNFFSGFFWLGIGLIFFNGNAQELTPTEHQQIRSIQQLLLSNPPLALQQTQVLATSTNAVARDCAQYYQANYYYNITDYQKAKPIFIALLHKIEQDKPLYQHQRYKDLVRMCVNKLFYIYKNAGDYNQALSLLKKYKHKIPEERYHEQMAIAKVAMGDYQNGIAQLKQNLVTSDYSKFSKGTKKAMQDKLLADKLNAIGEAYQKYYMQTHQVVHLDSAEVYFTKAANLMVQDHFQIAYTQALLGMHKAKNAALKGDYTNALRFYSLRKKYPEIQQNIRTVQIFDLGMADCYFHLKQPKLALHYAQQFVKNYQITKVSKENLLIAYTLISQSYKQTKNSEQAYNYAQKCLALIREMDAIKHTSLDFLHDYDLESIKNESDAILTDRNTFKFLLFGLIGLLVVVLGVFYKYHQKQKENKQRFLAIIQRLKESKRPIPNPVDKTIDSEVNKSMDSELVEKIQAGLLRLEAKAFFLKSDFKLATVAKKLNTNTAYLSQYFNQVLQKSFSEYTQELRVEYVLQKWNASTQFRNFTLQAIAEEVGYKDANTFVRVFKKQTGLTPNYYLENLRKQDV